MNRWILDDRSPSPQRTAAVVLLLVQSAALGILMHASIFATCAAAIALAGWVAPGRGLVHDLNRTYWFGSAALFFGAKYAFAPAEFEFSLQFVNTPLAYEIACFCIVVELVVLFMKEFVPRLPLWFLGSSAIGLIFTGDVRTTELRERWLLVLVGLFLLAWAAFAATSRSPSALSPPRPARLRMGVMLLVAGLSVGIGLFTAVHFRQSEQHMEQALALYLGVGETGTIRTGFSGRGGLSDVSLWKSVDGETMALQIRSDTRPPYLRGRVFNEFSQSRWECTVPAHSLSPSPVSDRPNLPRPFEYLYLLSLELPEPVQMVDVWPVDPETSGHFFLPAGAVGLACDADEVLVDESLIVTKSSQRGMAPYTALLSTEAVPEENREFLEGYLMPPENLHPDVIETARQIFAGASSTQQKVAAVEGFFHQNFEYHLGISVPAGEDRLAYFLRERPPAHCEYFATASALLLRLADVPTRYVTGYVASERNEVNGNWIARRKDAHAWVEAFDHERQRWVQVEATPAAGLPTPLEIDPGQQFREALAHWVRRTRNLLRSGDIWKILATLLQPLLWGLAGLLLPFAIWQALRTRKRRPGRPTIPIDQQETLLTRERQRMDHYLAQWGVTRPTEETVLRFARRVERANNIKGAGIARWYRAYLAMRFGGRDPSAEAIEQLQEERRRLVRGRRNNHGR